jgi:hypothetical protein
MKVFRRRNVRNKKNTTQLMAQKGIFLARKFAMWHEMVFLWHEMKIQKSKFKIEKLAPIPRVENSKKIIIIKFDLYKSSCLF